MYALNKAKKKNSQNLRHICRTNRMCVTYDYMSLFKEFSIPITASIDLCLSFHKAVIEHYSRSLMSHLIWHFQISLNGKQDSISSSEKKNKYAKVNFCRLCFLFDLITLQSNKEFNSRVISLNVLWPRNTDRKALPPDKKDYLLAEIMIRDSMHCLIRLEDQ